MFRSRSFKVVLAVVAVLIIASMAFAFADANTVPTNLKAGDGSGEVSGYAVSNIVYTYNAIEHGNIDQVDFKLNAPATKAQLQLVASGTYYDCDISEVDSESVSCDTTGEGPTQASVATTTIFRVIASSSTIGVATPVH